jgi:small conductance mechanosensitive channel
VGDFVDVAGVSGTVKEVSLFITEMSTSDNIQITIPNGQIWGNVIRNYSINSTRRMELSVGIGYGSNLDHAFRVIRETMEKDPRILKDPAPVIALTNLGASSLDLTVRCWTKTADYWPARFDLLKAIKETLDAEGIEIPFPQQVSYEYKMEKKA